MSEINKGQLAGEIIRLALLARDDEFKYYSEIKIAAKKFGIPLSVIKKHVSESIIYMKQNHETSKPSEKSTLGDDKTEDDVARAIGEKFAGRILFDHTQQRWFVWIDDRWKLDEVDIVFSLIRDFCQQERISSLDNHKGKNLGKIAFISNVERASRSESKLAVTHQIWDKDPWLLGIPGGVIDLRTGNTLSASPHYYISRQTKVAPAPPGTPAPLWEKFLYEATGGDYEFIAFLQRLYGYILTGVTIEEIFAFLYGGGGNGKGTFLRPGTQILHEYAASIPIEVFTASGRINLEYYRAVMQGKRLITTIEPESGAEWSESTIKEISGNETELSARNPYGRPFQFMPTCKIIAVGNHAPKLKGRSPAMERRLRVCPFDRVPSTPDQTLKDRLIDEYPAIFRWMLDGCLEWQRIGLGTCKAVSEASEHYFTAMDAFGEWLNERCILDPSLKISPNVLLSDFNAWAKASGRDQISSVAFAEIVDRYPNLRRERTKKHRFVCGVGLINQDSGGNWDRGD